MKSEVKRTFNPEFLNRLDEVIMFNALSEQDLIQILELMVSLLNQNLAQTFDHGHRDRRGQEVDPQPDAH